MYAEQIKVIVHGNKIEKFGNAFLTDNFTLYIDLAATQHEISMEKLGILVGDILLSCCFHDDVISFRAVNNMDNELISQVKKLIKNELARVEDKQL